MVIPSNTRESGAAGAPEASGHSRSDKWSLLFDLEAGFASLVTVAVIWSWARNEHAGLNLIGATFGALVVVSASNVVLSALGRRWLGRSEGARISGRIHNMVGGLSMLPLAMFLLAGGIAGVAEGDTSVAVVVLRISTALLCVPIAGAVLSWGGGRRRVTTSNVLGVLSLLLGITGFLAVWLLAAAGFAA